MTNEEFMFRLCTYVDVSMERIYYASGHIDQDMQEHAKKLVAVAERAKKCFHRMAELGLDEEDDFDSLMEAILDIEPRIRQWNETF